MPTSSRLQILVLAGALALPACNDKAPTDPTQTPDILGTYTAASFWFLSARRLSDDFNVTLDCPGNITVDQQAGSSFSGSFQIGGRCGNAAGTLTGTIMPDGAITFVPSLPGQVLTLAYLEQVTGCTVVQGSDTFTGTITGNRLQAELAVLGDCPGEGRIDARLEANGTA